MNKEDDREYFQRRAEQELALAQKADVPAVVAAHYKLAESYLDRVGRAGARTRPREQSQPQRQAPEQ